ncbi:MAG TPA: type II secretion system protein, partial [Acidimicrobiales bacterium]|nr:type II secretion system protein [Acidimicrobiales bacterium]
LSLIEERILISMREKFNEKRQEGFTLIELLIVVIILAILAAIVVFAVGTTATNAKQSACNADAKSVETALEAYKAQMGSYPPSLSNLTTSALDGNGNPVGSWLRATPNANTVADGYSISYDGAGGVWIQLSGNPTPTDFDSNVGPNGSSPCYLVK